MNNPRLTKRLIAVALLAGVVSAGAIWYSQRHHDPKPGQPAAPSAEIKVEFLAGAPEPGVQVQARILTDLSALPKASGEAKLVAAGHFEPSGAKFPAGLKVTWPLITAREPGSRLWIVYLDEGRKRWVGSGEQATVSLSGNEASGTVHHFSQIALSDSDPEQVEAPSRPTPPRDDKDKPNYTVITWNFKKVLEEGADARTLNKKDVAAKINAGLAGADPADPSKTKAIFNEYSFAQIEEIAKAKEKLPNQREATPLLSKEASTAMALHRREVVNQALAAALQKFDLEGKFEAGALDSGNKDSGIASDIDQTIFLLPLDPSESRPATSKQINEFNRAFEVEFKRITGRSPAWYGIECMNGADFYPDWYGSHSVSEFQAEADRVYLEKRKNPEAYGSEGQLKSQAEGRGYDALQQQIKKLTSLERARQKIAIAQEIEGVAEAEKLRVVREAVHDLLKQTLEKPNLEAFPINSLAEVGAAIKHVEDQLRVNSPWTEVKRDPKTGKIYVTQVASPAGRVLPNQPEFTKRFAFDGAWDNWFMYSMHPHNRTKYLIRCVAEGSGVVYGALGILGAKGEGKTLAPFEYDSIYGKGQHEALTKYVNSIYGHLDVPTIQRFKRSMDVAARVRLRHKGKEPFVGFDDGKVFDEYVKEVTITEADRKIFSEEALKKLVLERAQRAWEYDAREVMMENLLITANSPADLLNGGITDEQIRRLQEDPRTRYATREKLEAAVRKQFEHAFVELMTVEHAREIESGKKIPRATDFVDRILKKFELLDVHAEMVKITELAAKTRLALDPSEHKTRTFFQDLAKLLKKGWTEGGDRAEHAKREFEKWKKGEPGYTSKELASKVIAEAVERYQGRSFELLHTLGYEIQQWESVLGQDKGVVRLEPGKWDGRKALRNAVTVGNLDVAVQVWRTYLEDGSAQAAIQAACFQAAMNLPYVAEGGALLDLVLKKDPQGVVMLGAAAFIPGVGHAYLAVNLAKNAVWIAGYYVFQPLKDDIAEKTYQGFLDKKAGIISSGVKELERSQRPSLLTNVTKLRVIPYAVKDDDGKPLKDKKGQDVMDFAFAEYSFDEALDRGFLDDARDTFQADYDWLKGLGLLGGGKDYDELLKQAADEFKNPKLNFDARRASLFFAYDKRVQAPLKKNDIELRHTDDAFPIVKIVFNKSLHDWLRGEGEFAGKVDGEVNLLIEDKVEQVKDQIVTRMTQDFFWSYELIQNGKYSIENIMKARIQAAREERERTEAMQMLLSHLAGLKAQADGLSAAQAAADLVAARKTEYRTPEARIRLRPRVVKVISEVTKKEEDTVVCAISVVADPKQHSAPAGGYRYDARWETVKKGSGWVLKSKVVVKDAASAVIGEVEKEIATIGDDNAEIIVLAKEVEPDTFAADGTNYRTTFRVALRVKNAGIDPSTPLHVVLQTDDFTSHDWFFFGVFNPDDKVLAGQSQAAGLNVLWRYREQSVTITIEGPGIEAKRTIRLVPSDFSRTILARYRENYEKGTEAAKVSQKKKLDEIKRQIDESEGYVARLANTKMSARDLEKARLKEQIQLTDLRSEFEIYEKQLFAGSNVERERENARNKGDIEGFLAMSERALSLSEEVTRFEISLKYLQVHLNLQTAWAESANADEFDKKEAQKQIKNLQMNISFTQKLLEERKTTVKTRIYYEQMEYDAILGRWDSYISKLEAERAKTGPKGPVVTTDSYLIGFLLSANRCKAAAALQLRLWEAEYQKQLPGAKREQIVQRIRADIDQYYPWWPTGDDDPLAKEKQKQP